MYEVFEQLLQKHGVTAYQVSKATGIAQSTFSSWKTRKNLVSGENAKKIADYFGVTVDFLMTGRDGSEKTPELTKRDERDIAKRLNETLRELEEQQESLMFYGEPLDDETKELLIISLERSMRMAKAEAKEKYTPKKYKEGKDRK